MADLPKEKEDGGLSCCASLRFAPLIWRPTAGGAVANAFGVLNFYRIRGFPGEWFVECPKGASQFIQEGFETQSAARLWVKEDHAARLRAAFDGNR